MEQHRQRTLAEKRLKLKGLSKRDQRCALARARVIDHIVANPDAAIDGASPKGYFKTATAKGWPTMGKLAAAQVRLNVREHLGLPRAKGAHRNRSQGWVALQHRNLSPLEVALAIHNGLSLHSMLLDRGTTVDGLGRLRNVRPRLRPAGWGLDTEQWWGNSPGHVEPSAPGAQLLMPEPMPAPAKQPKAQQQPAVAPVLPPSRAGFTKPLPPAQPTTAQRLERLRVDAREVCQLLGCMSIDVNSDGDVSLRWPHFTGQAPR